MSWNSISIKLACVFPFILLICWGFFDLDTALLKKIDSYLLMSLHEMKSPIFRSHSVCEDCYANNSRGCQKFFWVFLTGFNFWKNIFQFSKWVYLDSLCPLKCYLLFPSPRLTFTWSIGVFYFYVFPNDNWTDFITTTIINFIIRTHLVVSLLHSIWSLFKLFSENSLMSHSL